MSILSRLPSRVDRLHPDRLLSWVLVAAVLLTAAVSSGFLVQYQVYVLILLIAGLVGIVLLLRPILGLPLLVLAALVVPISIGTGTAVEINKVTLLIPVLLVLWTLDMVRERELQLASSRTNRPLFLFLMAGLLSLFIGLVLWDPIVPRDPDFTTVQLAQWAIFAFSAGAFWLTGNLVRDETWLQCLTWLFLALAGGLALLRVIPFAAGLTESLATIALERSPFWMLLAAMAGGQVFFNRELPSAQRLFLWAALGATFAYSFLEEQDTASNWVGVATALGVLVWLRFPRIRWPVILLVLVLAFSGVLTSTVYEFAGGDAEWVESGGSRLALIGRVVDVTLQNPITGLGPAAYREYGRMEPLYYEGVYYTFPRVSSHNNYVDLFSHVGLVGLGLLSWFSVALARLGLRLRARFTEGFAAGYVNSMLAAGAGALVLMLFADWILPFVYNIGFPGFQASMLVWLFLGGLVALEQIAG